MKGANSSSSVMSVAQVKIENQKLHVELSSSEKVESLRFHDLAFELSNVTDVFTTQSPFDEISGMRVGTGIPHIICVGTWYHGHQAIFAAIHGEVTALVVSFENEKFSKIVVTTTDSIEIARTIRRQIQV